MTLDRKLAALADPAMGFIQKIRIAEDAIPGLSFANGWVTCPPPAGDLGDLPPMPVSGTGRTRDEALRRLMMEAVERNSSVYIGSETLPRAKADARFVVPLRSLLLYSKRQYAARRGAADPDDPDWIPDPLDSSALIRVAQAQSLLSGDRCPIPAALVYLGYRAGDEPLYGVADSNGCAAGDTAEEAIYRALLEVIERDAVAIWWFNRIPRPALGFEDDDLLCTIATALNREKRSIRLLNLTNDLRVPVVVAYSADDSGGHIYIGCAADICERRAAQRAACEMLQFWFWGRVSRDVPARIPWLRNETLDSQSWLQPLEVRPVSSTQELAVSEALPALVASAATCVSEPLVVDLTRPWFQIAVVKVFVPGMRSLSPQLAPGRLFDVPVKMGWRREPAAESELMPYPCPI